jgi:two-component system chemotaxis response regulator CheB
MARRKTHDIVVIGASMGGVEALSELVAQLPKDLPAAVCIVLHVAAEHRSYLPQILSRVGPLPAQHPLDHAPLKKGHIYVAPNDHHLLVDEGKLRVVKGPLENGHRPAVDPLFRSAARVYGPRVVGVVLTGARDCGTAGLLAVKSQGGIAVVQDPDDAACADMPRSALQYVNVDHCVRLSHLGPLLSQLVRTPVKAVRKNTVPKSLAQEVDVLIGRPEATNRPPEVGVPSHFSCPDCGGVLFELNDKGLLRYRCRVGHGYTGEALNDGQVLHVDSALWAAVRALEENASLARRLAQRARQQSQHLSARRYEERARAAESQAQAVRHLATHGRKHGSDIGLSGEEDETSKSSN